MKKYIFVLSLSVATLFASLSMSSYSQDDLKVLKSLDIDESFLKERAFINMKESILNDRVDFFLKKLNDAYIFVPIIKDMIKEAKIPQAFLYLAMAESNFSVRAFSSKRAVGLWQFMPLTAKAFGLKINNYVDERRDPIKSTEAAIAYLKYLHDMFGKWYLAAIAYNCGEGALKRAILRAKSDDLATLIDPNRKYLPKESRIYIRKILSLAFMSKSTNFLMVDNFEHLLNRGSIYPISSVEIKGGTHLRLVADSMNISLDELKKLNKQLKQNYIPPYEKRYSINIPYSRLALFKQNFKESKIKYLIHSVKRGESLYTIGKKYNIPYGLIKDANRLSSNRLSIEQELIIPISNYSKSTKFEPIQKSYRIKQGDSLDRISKEFGVSIEKLKRVNNLTSNFIRAGDMIVIPN